MSKFENINDDAYRSALQHSFFKSLESDLTNVDPIQPVQDFELCEENLNSNSKNNYMECNEKFNDHKNDGLLSTRSTKKNDSGNCLVPGSTSDYLFSGFFGQREKNDERREIMSNNFYTVTKPFPMAEDERKYTKTTENEKANSVYENLKPKILNKKIKMNDENFNGSFFSTSSMIKTTRNIRSSNNNNSIINNSTFSSNSNTNSFNDLVKSVSLSNLNKKKKSKIFILIIFYLEILSTEELLAEKINKEKEEMLRLRNINTQFHERNKSFVSRPITPSPLTLIKPFNLSANNSKMLMKKRTTTSNIDEINYRITETMKKKCEIVGEKIKDSVFNNDTLKLQKTPSNIRYMKKTLGRSVSRSKSNSKSPIKNKNCEDEMHSLSSRIEKYCTISGINSGVNASTRRSKSPVKICYNNNRKVNEDNIFNFHLSSILNTDLSSMTTSTYNNSTSIRKHFSNNISTDNKISKEMQTYKFKAKLLSKNVFSNSANISFNKKQPEIESFESILHKTRMEKQAIEKSEKNAKKMNKVNLIKQNKFNKMINWDKENNSLNCNNGVQSEKMFCE